VIAESPLSRPFNLVDDDPWRCDIRPPRSGIWSGRLEPAPPPFPSPQGWETSEARFSARASPAFLACSPFLPLGPAALGAAAIIGRTAYPPRRRRHRCCDHAPEIVLGPLPSGSIIDDLGSSFEREAVGMPRAPGHSAWGAWPRKTTLADPCPTPRCPDLNAKAPGAQSLAERWARRSAGPIDEETLKALGLPVAICGNRRREDRHADRRNSSYGRVFIGSGSRSSRLPQLPHERPFGRATRQAQPARRRGTLIVLVARLVWCGNPVSHAAYTGPRRARQSAYPWSSARDVPHWRVGVVPSAELALCKVPGPMPLRLELARRDNVCPAGLSGRTINHAKKHSSRPALLPPLNRPWLVTSVAAPAASRSGSST